jgi:hypothetical protein
VFDRFCKPPDRRRLPLKKNLLDHTGQAAKNERHVIRVALERPESDTR